MVAGAAEVAVVRRSLLFAMGRADATVHVENDHLRRGPVMNTVDPRPVHVGQDFNVRIGRQKLRLEAAHLAGGRSLSFDGLAPNNPTHGGITSKALSVVHVFITADTSKQRLAELLRHAVPSVLASTDIVKHVSGNLAQAKGIIKLSIGEKPAIYRAGSWNKKRRVVAKVEWHPGELYPRVGFIVTNLSRPAERVVAFYNHRGTAEQFIKEGKNAIKWTRLSCRKFRNNEVRLQLHALAYNLANFMRTLALPKEVKHWSLATLREKLVKIGAKVVRHGRYVIFQLPEVAVPRSLFRKILSMIDDLRRRPVPA